MNRYIPTSGETVAQQLTSALWALSVPPSHQVGNGTTELFGAVTMRDGSVWLCCDTTVEVPVHEEAALDGIADIMQPWIDAGQLPSDTNEQLAALIDASKGHYLNIYDAFPQLFKDQSKTQTELVALNLYPPVAI